MMSTLYIGTVIVNMQYVHFVIPYVSPLVFIYVPFASPVLLCSHSFCYFLCIIFDIHFVFSSIIFILFPSFLLFILYLIYYSQLILPFITCNVICWPFVFVVNNIYAPTTWCISYCVRCSSFNCNVICFHYPNI